MSFLTTSWVSTALGLPPPADERQLTQICSDSRAVVPGAVFVCLVGENTDGHLYMEDVLAKGAVAVVHSDKVSAFPGLLSFPVSDTLQAWRRLAGAWRSEFSLPVVAVAGSAGKTTSKEMVAALLRGKYSKVLVTEGSQNGYQGIPTTLLRFQSEHDAAVVEVGIDEQGAMIQHLDLVRPDAGLLTSIGPEHLEKLVDLDTVEKEEGLLFSALERHDGFAAVNQDDERIVRQAGALRRARKLTYGIENDADIRGKIVGNDLEVVHIAEEPIRFPLPLEGKHNALNLLGAITLAQGLGLSPEEMAAGLRSFAPPPGRSESHEWQGAKILVDTYNANPNSVVAALETLFDGFDGESWAVLGDMLELGTFEESLHRSLAEALLRLRVKHVLLYGPRMMHLVDELRRRQFTGTLEHFDAHALMAARLRASVKAGHRVLLKGSRGMRMETIWKALRGE
jgi:UDP-N-acetylmuramoyl-tripeptide--D-alanyl-D-alanine ligase